MTPRAIASVVVLLVACGGKRTDSCREQAAAMKTFMRDLLEGRTVSSPWATGEAALDLDIERRRSELRELQVMDSNKPARPLTGEIKPGPIDHELASCPPATEQLVKVGSAWTSEEKLAAWVGIADAIETCECRPRIAYLKPLFHMLVRGPD